MARVGDFASKAAPVSPETPGAQIVERFEQEPDTLAIAVVDADGRPVGLVERNAFTLRMAAEFGRALYARRPASSFMDPNPRVLDAAADAETLFDTVDAASLGALLNGFVVTADGRYAGVGAGVHLLQAGSAVHRRRAEAMSALARDFANAEREARTSSRAKSEFLAVMSHEIRTPLNGVLGVAALMERELTQEALRPYVRTILDSGRSLLRLLTDALDMSRAEAGLMAFETAPVRLDGLADDLLALWSPRAGEKALALTVACEAEGADCVVADETRLKQLLSNLIGNAIKFTPSGAVEVRLRSRAVDGAAALTITVDDSGPGVADDAAEAVFEPFNTGGAGREGAGAGLGLAICRQIVERMAGEISVGRGPLGGARFTVVLHLPLADAAVLEEAARMSDPTPHETLHVLVVDDNPTNRFVAGKVLELFGCSHEAAENGREAVERMQATPFDLVLMDIKMPVMDGVEATRAIRGLAGPAARVPILALTANADSRDEAEYLAAGMNGVAQKPIQPDLLLDAIRRVLAPAPPEAAAA
ncbi:ATP-binding protein [uncultured Brevundimonas sp.]|uniref:ATP-binding protein n=1 Tax=uncultured Brevundimonas sp. TaxID=213418 RepID=UPI00261E95D9|nr:ATP-binding protein [uncultured Brevundimonas sp.]